MSLPKSDFLKPPWGISATSGMWSLIHTVPNCSALEGRTKPRQRGDALARVNPRHLTPSVATVLFGVLACVWLVGLTVVSQNVLADSIVALGFGIAFYYGITGLACVVYYRRQLFRSVKNFVFMGLAPLLGAAILFWAFGKSAIDFADPANSESATRNDPAWRRSGRRSAGTARW